MESNANPGSDFAKTEPMELELLPEGAERQQQPAARPPAAAAPPRTSGPDLGGLSLAPVQLSLYEAMAELGKGHRVCPQPTRWLEFYRILVDAAGGKPLPASPVSGSAWAATPASVKGNCFREQVEWADRNGCLQACYDFLHGLPASDWYCDAPA